MVKIKNEGKLYVFEGADNTGKTTTAKKMVAKLKRENKKVVFLSFPGKNINYLGKEIYKLHSKLFALREQVQPISIQLLHIASHINIIESEIKPYLKKNYIVILDRYWWSTWVYGIVKKIDPYILKIAISTELMHWGSIIPTCVFLFDTKKPHCKVQNYSEWKRIKMLYRELFKSENVKKLIISDNKTISNFHIIHNLIELNEKS